MPISAVINTYNAADTLPEILPALQDFDEILVCDMESTDNTVEIALSAGARVITFPKGNHTHAEPARNFAIHSAAHPWVLMIDADEIASPELRQYLYDFIKDPGTVRGLYIPRKNLYLNSWRRSNYPDYQLRFFYRDLTNWPPEVHTFPKVEGDLKKIPASRHELALTHLAPSMSAILDRLNRYTTSEVEKRKNEKVSVFKLFFDPAQKFFTTYFLKGAWRCGAAGVIAATNDAYYRFMRLAKIYESKLKIKN